MQGLPELPDAAAAAEERSSWKAKTGLAGLWPPQGEVIDDAGSIIALQEESQAEVSKQLAQALRLAQPRALAYRFFMVVATLERSASAELSQIVLELQRRRIVVRDVDPLHAAGAEDSPTQRLLLLLQPWIPVSFDGLVVILKSAPFAAGLALHPAPEGHDAFATHWRDTHLQVMRRFPQFFQQQWQVLVTQSMPASSVNGLVKRLLLHDFAVRAAHHRLPPASAVGASAPASLAVRGVGQVVCCNFYTSGTTPTATSAGAVAVGGALTAAAPGGAAAPLATTAATLASPPPAPGPSAAATATAATAPGAAGAAAATYPQPAGATALAAAVPKATSGILPGAGVGVAQADCPPALWCGIGLPANTAVFSSLRAARESKAADVAGFPPNLDGDPEVSALLVFSDALGFGVDAVTRELLLLNGFLILSERRCHLSPEQMRLLFGLPPPPPRVRQDQREAPGVYAPGFHPSLLGWLDHLLQQEHHLFVVRRCDAIALLLQLSFGPSMAKAGEIHRVLQWPFMSQLDAARPAQAPLFTSLHGLLREEDTGKVAGVAPGCSRPTVPMLVTTCHSQQQASAVLASISKDVSRCEEIVVVLPSQGPAQSPVIPPVAHAPAQAIPATTGAVGHATTTPQLDALNHTLSSQPLGCMLLQTSTSGPALLQETRAGGSTGGAIAKDMLDRVATAWNVAPPAGSSTAVASLCARLTLRSELQAVRLLRHRRAKGLALKCAISEAYDALLSRGALFITEPSDVDAIVDSIWPTASLLSGLAPDSVARCLRIVEPYFGFAKAVGIAVDGALRQDLATWKPGTMVWHSMQHGSSGTSAELELAGIRLNVQLQSFHRPDGGGSQDGIAVLSAEQALRPLLLSCLVQQRLSQLGQGAADGVLSWRMPQVMLYPRNAHESTSRCAVLALRDAAPWHLLSEYPQVYVAEGNAIVVALTRVELMEIDLDSSLRVRVDMSTGKVRRGWQLLKGADVPLSTADANIREVFQDLVRRCQSGFRPTTLVFQDPGSFAPTVAVERDRALAGVELCSRGTAPSQVAVVRRSHAATEALLVGATLARLIISLERSPVSLAEAEAAVASTRRCAHGISEALMKELMPASASDACARLMPIPGSEWAASPGLQKHDGLSSFFARRVLCNESSAAALEIWRELGKYSEAEKAEEDAIYATLAEGVWDAAMEGSTASYLSFEALPSSSEVLLHFAGGAAGSQPMMRFWGPLPVMSRLGRLAAQVLTMLRLDSALSPYLEGSIQKGLCTGFLRAYEREAPGKHPLFRLHFHCLLCLLEASWLDMQRLAKGLRVESQQLRASLSEAIRHAATSMRDAGIIVDSGAGVGTWS